MFHRCSKEATGLVVSYECTPSALTVDKHLLFEKNMIWLIPNVYTKVALLHKQHLKNVLCIITIFKYIGVKK